MTTSKAPAVAPTTAERIRSACARAGGAMLAVEAEGDRLRPEELIGMLFLLLVAGHETTVNLLGSGLLALLQHPEQHERLRADRGLMGPAVEEMLRYCSPVETSTARFTLAPTEICGQVIPAEEMVIAGLMSANHDPEVFAEPERFDVGRTPNKHMAFGMGIHYCLGAPLARLELALSLRALVRAWAATWAAGSAPARWPAPAPAAPRALR